jgi:cytochrome P450
MESVCPFAATLADAIGQDLRPSTDFDTADIPLMPLGQAADMGRAPDGTPLIDPRLFSSAEYARNPYPYFRILRDHYPVFHDEFHNCYYVTRFEDVKACANDEVVFNTIGKGASNTVLGNTQLELSGPENRRRRNLYGQHLVGEALKARRPAIRRIAEELIDSWDHCDDPTVAYDSNGVRSVTLGKGFSNEFPIRVVGYLLGLPDEARANFYYWYNAMMNGFGGATETHGLGLTARQDLEDYVEGLVQARRAKPHFLYDDAGNPVAKDITTALCEARIDGDVLSTEEITSNIALLVGGGGETTRGAIMNMWYLLLQHPEQLAAVREDPGLWQAAFHEGLRCAIPAGGAQPKNTTYDIEMHGVKIPAGSLVLMVNHAANRDDRVFEDADNFNILRGDLYSGKLLRSGYASGGKSSHMSFGIGPHFCPGAWISEQEAILGSSVLIERMRNVRIKADAMPKDIDGVTLAPIGLVPMRELWVEYDLD